MMPSEDTLLKVIMILSLAGVAVAGYLTVHSYILEDQIFCEEGQVFNCDEVIQSDYSKVFGVSVALMGFVGNIAMFGAAFARFMYMDKEWTVITRPLLLILTISALVFVLYLIAAELFWISPDGPKICTWCTVAHAILFCTLPFVIMLNKGNFGSDFSAGLDMVFRRKKGKMQAD